MSYEHVIATLRQRYRRRFPTLLVALEPRDYGHEVRVTWFTRPDDNARHFQLLPVPVALDRGVLAALDRKILRTAYPRGWATQ